MAVTPDMVAVALGVTAPDPDSVTAKQWQLWLDDAYMLIESRRTAMSPAPDVDEAKIDYVVREAVVAQVKRPDDATQVTISVDDASSSKTYQSSKGRVTIVDDWWVFLGLTEPNGGAYAIDTIGASSYHLPWCSLSLGAQFCSCGADIAGRPIYENGGL
ncbi:hypothetical protein [Curtobacterium sp. USHLN213]|uniref:hypothetical protein n=1 Tax=Curtobacterium sp. USHLN213 TaxID=3081255 RepID=UPI0030177556